jgi:hypothetical protein
VGAEGGWVKYLDHPVDLERGVVAGTAPNPLSMRLENEKPTETSREPA